MKKFFIVLFMTVFLFACGEKVAKVEEFNRTPQSYGGTSFKFLPTEKLDYRYKFIIFAGNLNAYNAGEYLEAHSQKGDYPGDAIIKGKGYDGGYSYIIFSDATPDPKFIPRWEWLKK